MLRFAMAVDGFCGGVAEGLPVSAHVKINHSRLVKRQGILNISHTMLFPFFPQYKQLHTYSKLDLLVYTVLSEAIFIAALYMR